MTTHVENSLANEHATAVLYGIKFVAGQLEFSFTAVSPELLCTLRMFTAVQKGELNELKSIIDANKSADFVSPYGVLDNINTNQFSNISMMTNHGVDVNVEYQPPSYYDETLLGLGFNHRRSSVQVIRNLNVPSPVSPVLGVNFPQDGYRLLLHIAIEQNNLEMITFLLSENADVRMYVCLFSSSGTALPRNFEGIVVGWSFKPHQSI